MSRLHALVADVEKVALRFGIAPVPSLIIPQETVEGGPGIVVIPKAGGRILKTVTWGFPRPTHALHGEDPGRVGMVADLTNPMWEETIKDPKYRCLIPITHFANPDGDHGAKTRTWFSVKDQPIMAWV